ncbi:MAG: ATP-binding protein, partial [Nitratireductor sp.]
MAKTNQKIRSSLSLSTKRKSMLAYACLFAAIFVCLTAASNSAFAQTKSLKLYFLHTGEKNTVTYYKNGRYVAAGL